MVCRKISDRLGCGPGGADEIEHHAFFAPWNFAALRSRTTRPPAPFPPANTVCGISVLIVMVRVREKERERERKRKREGEGRGEKKGRAFHNGADDTE